MAFNFFSTSCTSSLTWLAKTREFEGPQSDTFLGKIIRNAIYFLHVYIALKRQIIDTILQQLSFLEKLIGHENLLTIVSNNGQNDIGSMIIIRQSW